MKPLTPTMPTFRTTDPRDVQVAAQHQIADVTVGAGSFSVQAKVAVTTGGLLAIAALVSAILLSTAVLVREAKK